MSLEALCFLRRLLPACGDSLPLGVELNGALAVEVRSTPHAGLVSSEGEHRKGDRDGQVDADLASFDLRLEFAGSVAISREDSASIAPGVSVDEVDSLLKGFTTHDLHDWAEDLLVVAFEAGLHVVDNGRANPIALGVAFNLDTTAVE